MFTFHRKERLKSRKIIGQLFQKGHSFISYPIRFVWVKMDSPLSEYPIQMAQTVPKRAFSKAVDRNRLRRRIREAYRINKHSIYEKLEDQKTQYGLMLIYVAKQEMTFQEIEKGVKKGLGKMGKRIADS